MVSDSKSDGGTQNLSSNLQKTIQSIKEVVRNHSESEIYYALKETNMNADETAQKLLSQEPFHEVRHKRDRKKENASYSSPVEQRKKLEDNGHPTNSAPAESSGKNAGYARPDAGGGREFRVVRDNRVNYNTENVKKPATVREGSTSGDRNAADVLEKSSMGALSNRKTFARRYTAHLSCRMRYSQPRFAGDTKTNGDKKEFFLEIKSGVPSSVSHTKIMRQCGSQSPTSGMGNSNSIVGVYASASDPVHVPSISSRPPAAIWARRCEIGSVGFRQQISGNNFKQSLRPGSSNSNYVMGSSSAMPSYRVVNTVLKNDNAGHAAVTDSLTIVTSGGRGLLRNNHGRSHQLGHLKGAPPNKEWKPRPIQKSNGINLGVIGTPIKSGIPTVDNSKSVEEEAAELHDKLSQVNILETENVIIAQHIRVPENDRCQLTFGCFSMDPDIWVSEPHVVRHVGESLELSGRNDVSAENQVNPLDEQVRNSGSSTPSGSASEHVFADIKDSSSAPTLESLNDLGLVHENTQVLTASEPQQYQIPSELPSFSAYDSQTGYDVPFFRHSIDEAVRGHGLPSSQEVLTSHTATNLPASSMNMMQQGPLTQMYPQVQVSHFPNVMPYRQFVSPMYVPPMGLTGYSGNPAYPHPSNGSSYVLMPGGSSHLNANNLKYGIQQFKPVPTGNPTFGNFASPAGYALNPGIVGSVPTVEDSSRIKYKDSNLYLKNPQAETSEVWIQTPRELPGMQSAPYYNMQGQTAHPAYLQSLAGHAPYNAAAVAHSSNMPFPGLYHPQQPAAMTNPHHLAPPMGGSPGVGIPSAAPGVQLGAFQQPQFGHLNWATNF